MQELFLGYSYQTHLVALILGSTRLMVFVSVAPFMGHSVLSGMTRAAVVFSLYCLLHPMILMQTPQMFPLTGMMAVTGIGLILKEILLGFLLGYLAGFVFWAIESAGFFIDNQRGAGQASETDPLTGSQSSPTGSFLFQSLVYVFFATGTFLVFLGIVYASYGFWPVNRFIPAGFFTNPAVALFFGECVAKLALNMVLLSAPVVLGCLFTDMSLGLINRFASQLNVYVLSMAIKSGIASFLLIYYFAILMSDAPERFQVFSVDMGSLRTFMR